MKTSVVLAVVLGCGPSFRSLQESEERFERCYALDETPNAPLDHRMSCWKVWTDKYSTDATRDRLRYAVGRRDVLMKEAEKRAPPVATSP